MSGEIEETLIEINSDPRCVGDNLPFTQPTKANIIERKIHDNNDSYNISNEEKSDPESEVDSLSEDSSEHDWIDLSYENVDKDSTASLCDFASICSTCMFLWSCSSRNNYENSNLKADDNTPLTTKPTVLFSDTSGSAKGDDISEKLSTPTV